MNCSKCNAGHLHRSHRRGPWEYVASLVERYPYRCGKCGHRSLLPRTAAIPKDMAHPSPVEEEIKATRAAISWKRRRRELFIYLGGFLLFVAFLYFITRERSGSPDGN